MPKVSEQLPEGLRAFAFHGIDLRIQGDNATADCPFCGGEAKFAVNILSGQYRCYVCGGPSDKGGGNIPTFLRELYDKSLSLMDWADLDALSVERKIPASVLKEWGVVKSAIDGEWLLPGYHYKNGISNLYRYGVGKGGKRRLMGTTTLEHCLFGIQFWDDNKPEAYITEGPWDSMMLRHALMKSKKTEEGNVVRSFNQINLYSTANVVAVPGCESFKESWVAPFQGKNVFLAYDSDHPKKDKEGKLRLRAGKPIIPGYNGMQLAARMLKPVANSISMINWGESGWDESLPDGFDVKDYLTIPMEQYEEENKTEASVEG